MNPTVRLWCGFIASLAALLLIPMCALAKEAGVFFPPDLIAKARANVARDPWAAEQKKLIVESAQPWVKMSDEDLWGLMFGPTLHRAWHVLSDGDCPSCRKPVPMYNWKHDFFKHPWKVRCPQCGELFPKNDFYRFYLSGLDKQGLFDPERADRSLLFNTEHPDPDDSLHRFGVDDGNGYVEGDRKWQFISAYLIYGQWKQAVLGGIRNLATAYVVTGDRKYAHKAAVLLDRVADLYPAFDFKTQADLYDNRNQSDGYVSVWHDACEETRELAMAYDMVFDALSGDAALVEFLSRKSREHALPNSKASIADICRNIEDRILRDALANQHKIHSNYPRTEIARIVMMSVLGWPGNKDEVTTVWDTMLERATAVDGVTGEKGLAGYSAFTIQSVAGLLEQFCRCDPGFLADALKRHPRIRDMFRFHIDTWCMQQYYPQVGDSGSFARKCAQYVGVVFMPNPAAGSMWTFALTPSSYTFLWRLYLLTGDPAFVQVLYRGNNDSADNLPHDLFWEDPMSLQKSVKNIIAREGPAPKLESVNKQQWHIAVLRSGEGENERAVWLQYDSMGGHGHANCMHLGMFAKGLDLMPDFGYKPVQFGGWGSPKANWYGMTAAHNTVVVDGKDQGGGAGETTLWADGKQFHAIRASAPAPAGVSRFERTVGLVDVSGTDFYVLDIFRVVGGTDHAKFTGSHFGTITTNGLNLSPSPEYGFGTQMRDFKADAAPKPGWSVDWKIEDRYKYLPTASDVHFRYTDLTTGAQAYTAEAWIAMGTSTTSEAWIPRIITRRRSQEAPLASTFVSVMEPYEKTSAVQRVNRLPLETPEGASCPGADVAVEVVLADGRRDLIIARDAQDSGGGMLVQKDWNVRTDGELCMARLASDGKVERVVICKGGFLSVGETDVRLKGRTDFVEIMYEKGKPSLVSAPQGSLAGM